ncbi:MAG TPA: FkbM family methyltransferase [Burkholderiaceae bacterium]
MRFFRGLLQLLGHQHFLRFGVRDRIIRRFHDPDRAPSEEFTVPFHGQRYRGNFNTFIDWSVFYYGAYTAEELRLAQEVLEPMADPVVFDVGANIGHHALFMAAQSKQVFAFEPFPDVYRKLLEKVHDNQITNLELCPFGLGERNAVESYFPPGSNNTGTGSFASNASGTQAVQLEVRRGDDCVRDMGIDRLDFIKMDVEGFEPFALRGLRQTLNQYRPVVFFEWTQNEKATHDGQAGPELFPHDYLFYQFVSDTVSLVFFRQPTYRLERVYDRWADGNLLAIPKEYVRRVKAQQTPPAIAHRLGDLA